MARSGSDGRPKRKPTVALEVANRWQPLRAGRLPKTVLLQHQTETSGCRSTLPEIEDSNGGGCRILSGLQHGADNVSGKGSNRLGNTRNANFVLPFLFRWQHGGASSSSSACNVAVFWFWSVIRIVFCEPTIKCISLRFDKLLASLPLNRVVAKIRD
jgi:hypothetical protein